MNLFKILFGRKKIISDDFLGEIKSERIRFEKKNKSYSWFANPMLSDNTETTTIIIEGNYKNPDPIQLHRLKNLLSKPQFLFHKIDDEIKKHSFKHPVSESELFEKWRSAYYLSAFFPLNQNQGYEICFDPIQEDAYGHIMFDYFDDKITNFDFKNANQVRLN